MRHNLLLYDIDVKSFRLQFRNLSAISATGVRLPVSKLAFTKYLTSKVHSAPALISTALCLRIICQVPASFHVSSDAGT